MRLGPALRELHRSENELARDLLRLGERHKVDHEIFHLTRDLARWSRDHVREIARIGADYDVDLDPEPREEAGLLERAREVGSELIGRRGEAGLALLRDLRQIYLSAAGVFVDWELLAQAAQGIRHLDLLEVAERCMSDTERQMKWANSKIKESSTQVLVS